MKTLLIFLLLSLATGISGAEESYSSFSDCILINMRGVSNELAAAMIRDACLDKFPEQRAERETKREIVNEEEARNKRIQEREERYKRDQYECRRESAMVPYAQSDRGWDKKSGNYRPGKMWDDNQDRRNRRSLYKECMSSRGWKD